MRALIRTFDGLLRRAYGVFEFCDDPNCVLRLRVTRASHTLSLQGNVLPAGTPVLELHLWNEHIPPIPPEGPDLAWAIRSRRMLIDSLRAVAHQIRYDPRLAGVQAIRGVTVLLPPGDGSGGRGLMKRLGFVVFPYCSPLGRFGEFWENLYSWGIMWAFNEVSLRHRQLIRLRRTEVWMSVNEFLRRYD